jgi:hypothetical protein
MGSFDDLGQFEIVVVRGRRSLKNSDCCRVYPPPGV